MRRGLDTRAPAIAPLLYWLLVVGGLLAAHRVLEHGAPTRAVALWAGAVLGTAIGQGAAWRRISFWAVVLFVPVLMVAALQLAVVVCIASDFALHSADPWSDVGLAAMAFAPGVACGYASLSERGGLLAFWFPTALWSLAILDGADGTALAGAWSWVLLTVLAALFIALLGAREARRVALWQRHASVRLSTPRETSVLRRSPTGGLSQAAWTAATAAATLVLTAWIAPHLWQNEKTAAGRLDATMQAAGGLGGGPPCCPDVESKSGEGHRLSEYFPLLGPHGDQDSPPEVPCVACATGAGSGPALAKLSPLAVADASGPATSPVAAGVPPAAGDAAQVLSTTAQAPPPLAAPPLAPATSPPPPPMPPVAAHAHLPPPSPPPAGAPAVHHVHPAPAPAQGVELHLLPGLLALVLSGLLVQLALRPLRRMVTLRHLRESLWAEPVDQRVSNLWQLVLVGLRDAGWHAAPGEQPMALARRAALPGAEACAMVLERARHGARLETTDLESMTEAARTAYRAARRRVGHLARALSWLRWPLV